MKLYKDRGNRDVLKFCFVNRAMALWHKLPEKIMSVNIINI